MKKKLFAIIASVTMLAVLLAGCSKQGGSSNIKTVTPGTLTVALSPDFAPMEFVDTSKTGQDQYVGFDVFLAKFLAEDMGLKLEIKAMGFDACQAAVQAGAVDMSISGFSYTETRAQGYNLSDYYYAGDNETKQIIITTAANEGKLTTAADYSGKTVGAQTASLQMNYCTTQLPSDAIIKEYGNIDTAIEALRNGMIDAVAVAEGNGNVIINNVPGLIKTGFEFEVAEEEENNLILLQKGNDALTEIVNKSLAKAYEAGYYPQWYAQAQELAGLDTAEEVVIPDETESGASN
ncbi:MAG: transporter substrate-binding domain-containing protein [Lachnospiraceae bacterium]|nr:transporter substrate-binding domain-containing protein [Lachnospiraceae bacterium]